VEGHVAHEIANTLDRIADFNMSDEALRNLR
jgi:hypothetical protein